MSLIPKKNATILNSVQSMRLKKTSGVAAMKRAKKKRINKRKKGKK